MERLRGGAAIAAVLLCTLTGCKDDLAGNGTTGPGGTPAATGGAALAAADALTVKGRAPKTGYEREKFGTAWADTDSNDCDTRIISMLRRVTDACAQVMQGVVNCAY
ncbi:hypothetical protein [Streptomyces longwoodensis]|uniref:hypothetical protein n=1 Tax=Streptomyces longwoodensis TaxID=68231 RepID=UPI0036E5168C